MIDARDGWFFVSTRHTSYIMKVGEAGHLEHVHYGGYIPSDAEGLGCIQGPDDIRIGDGTYYDEEHQHTLLARKLLEYSAPGKGDTRESAVIAEYRNGLITLDPPFRSFRIYEGKDYPVLPAVSGEGASTLEITLRDAVFPIDIILRYSAYEEEDVIVRSAEIRNGMDEPLLLRSFASAMLDLPDAGWDIMTFDGTWGRERKENRRRLVPGVSYVDSKLGASSNEHNPLVILLRPETDDRHGEAIAVNMVYSGNHMEKERSLPMVSAG